MKRLSPLLSLVICAFGGEFPLNYTLSWRGNSSSGAADEGHDMRHISSVFICRNYLAGNRETVSFVPAPGKEAECVAAAGDYVFTGGWKERGSIAVNRLSDGRAVGVFDPSATVGGNKNTGYFLADMLLGGFRDRL